MKGDKKADYESEWIGREYVPGYQLLGCLDLESRLNVKRLSAV